MRLLLLMIAIAPIARSETNEAFAKRVRCLNECVRREKCNDKRPAAERQKCNQRCADGCTPKDAPPKPTPPPS